MDYSQIAATLFKLGVAMAVGFWLRKRNTLSDSVNQALSSLILNVTCPVLIVYSVCGQSEPGAEVIRLFGFGVALYLVVPLLALLLVPSFFAEPEKRSVYRMLLMFGNVNFMGFPVIQALYGSQAIFYMNILNIPFTLLMFTYGVRRLRAGAAVPETKIRLSDILNPGLVAGLISLAIYFFRVPVPELVVGTLGFIGGITTPLSMIVIGSMVADFSFRQVLAERKLFAFAALKLLALPVLGFFAARAIFPTGNMAGVITVSLAMPSASLCAMVCRQYGTPLQAKTSVLGVLISTAFSVVTLPLILLLLR